MMERAKLLSMTVVLTVVIWASADSLVNEAVSIHVRFEIVPSATAPNMIIVGESDRGAHELKITGRRGAVQAIRDKAPLAARLSLPDLPTGLTKFPLDRAMLKAQLARQWTEFHQLTIVSVEPDTVSVLADHWVTLDVPIVMTRLSRTYDVEPQLRQNSVSVRMRESTLVSMPSGGPLPLDFTNEFERLIADQPAGQSVIISVPLDPRPFGPGAVLTPRSVEVTATLKPQYRTAEISTVPILVAVSFPNLEKTYRAVTRDGAPYTLVTQTIRVTGPNEDVVRLERGTTRAFGVVRLKQNDLDQLGVLRLFTPEYYLPDGLKLADAPPPIELKLVLADGAP